MVFFWVLTGPYPTLQFDGACGLGVGALIQAESKIRLRKTVSLGNDTPEMVSAKMSKTYQMYVNAKDGDTIEFVQKSL